MLDQRAKDFFARVLPWPEEDNGRYSGWCNIHWTLITPDGTKIWAGKPFATPTKMFGFIDWLVQQKNTRDIYMCLSTQRECTVKDGKQKAVRRAENALALKSIWLDLDVRTPGTPKDKIEYDTVEAAVAALGQFVARYKIPGPSAIVGSGGGLHVYWINKTPLPPGVWAGYAASLRAAADEAGLYYDGGCTIDSARILRVPGTSNWKTELPRATKVLGLGADVDLATVCAALPAGGPITAPVTHGGTLGRMDPIWNTGEPLDFLQAGCERELPPLDVKSILTGCAFLRDAVLSGGKSYANPLWHLTTLCATFLPDGRKYAHGFAAGHTSYRAAETDALFDRKVRERDERGIGWPGCAAIAASGSTRCKSCPHFGRGKSPLNLGLQIYQPASNGTGSTPANAAAQAASGSSLELPAGYAVNTTGHICKLEEVKSKEEDQPPDIIYIKLFQNLFTNPWLQRSPLALNFTTTLDLGRTGGVCLTQSSMAAPHDLSTSIFEQGVLPDPEGEKYVRKFFMSWLGKLQAAKSGIESRPFGWIYGDHGREGFAFGGMSFRRGGSKTTSGFITDRMRENYTPKGSMAPWIEATKLITDRKRPDLDCLLVSGFASPLIAIPAQHAVLLSVFGATGNGKSTAITLGLSVWGNPKRERHVKDSSPKSVIAKLGELNNLPSYWDEMSIDKQKNVYDVFTTVSEGVEGTKLKSDRSFAKQGDWQTMMVLTSNSSFLDCVVLKAKDTSAGLYRVFEYRVAEPTHEPGLISEADASRIMQKLEQNYGQVGLAYAELLGRDPASADKFVMACVNDIRDAVKPRKEERYWPAAAGCLLAGGHYAKTFGVDIDIDALRKFIIRTYLANRDRVAREGLEGGTVNRTEDILAGFLKAYRDETLWTDFYSKGRGKHVVNWLDGPPRGPSSRKTSINVHWAVKERKLRISRATFFEWLSKDSESVSSYVVSGLIDHLGARYDRVTLGAGTSAAGTNEFVIEVSVPPGHALEEAMLAYPSREIDTGGVVSAATDKPVIPTPRSGSIIEAAVKQAQEDLARSRKP
jgi:Domain of unknown function (DUF927)